MCTMALSCGTGCVPWHYHVVQDVYHGTAMWVKPKWRTSPFLSIMLFDNIPGSRLYTAVQLLYAEDLAINDTTLVGAQEKFHLWNNALTDSGLKINVAKTPMQTTEQILNREELRNIDHLNDMESVSNKDGTSHKDVDLWGQAGRNWWRCCVITRCPYNHMCMRSSLDPPLCMCMRSSLDPPLCRTVNFGQWRLTKRGKLPQNEDVSWNTLGIKAVQIRNEEIRKQKT